MLFLLLHSTSVIFQDIRKIEKIQHQALRFVFNDFKSVSAESFMYIQRDILFGVCKLQFNIWPNVSTGNVSMSSIHKLWYASEWKTVKINKVCFKSDIRGNTVMIAHTIHMFCLPRCFTVYNNVDSCLDSQNLRAFKNQ